MSRQHAAPVLVPADGDAVALAPLGLGPEGHGWSEAQVQALIHEHPACLPVAEIDPLFARPVPICTELNTTAGPIDNLLVTQSGLPVLAECKLWRNPQARREVVGQILDYAKELSRWSSSDLQREVRRRLACDGDPVLELVRAAGHEVEEIAFNDALTHNLRRGRFLLLIVGDGIREGVEAIAEYLQAQAGLHFTLGLVELPIHALPDGGRLVTPRVLARTEVVTRTVIATPPGYDVAETGDEDEDESTPEGTTERETKAAARARRRASRFAFWTAFLAGLTLDDPDQEVPRPAQRGHIVFPMPVQGRSCWLSVYRSGGSGRIGLFLSGTAGGPGEAAAKGLIRYAEELRTDLGPTARIAFSSGFPNISDDMPLADFDDLDARDTAFIWLRRRCNEFVNALRPRLRVTSNEQEKT